MPTSAFFDVAIIGAGPAGCTAGMVLAKAGYSVGILEQVEFPRHHIGESLQAITTPYLKQLDLWDDLHDRGYIRKPGALFAWGKAAPPLVLDMPQVGYSFQVPRADFDDFLLQRCRHMGVSVYEATRVEEIDIRKDGVGLRASNGDADLEVRASYIIDASGNKCWTAKRLGLHFEEYDGARLAISTYYSRTIPLETPHEGRIITEACDSGWVWLIPLGADLVSVGLVTDARRVRAASNPATALAEELASAPYTNKHLHGAEQTSDPAVIRYANYRLADPKWSRRIVRVGDAAMFIDPLFSTGVHTAIYSAFIAASALADVMAGIIEEDEASAAYDAHCDEYFFGTRELVRLLYGFHRGTGDFWRDRAVHSMTAEEAKASIRALGISGSITFRSMLDLLEMPEAFRGELERIVVPRATAPLPAGSRIRLSENALVEERLVFVNFSMRPGYKVLDRQGRTAPLSVPAGREQIHLVTDLLQARPANEWVVLKEHHSIPLATMLVSTGNASVDA